MYELADPHRARVTLPRDVPDFCCWMAAGGKWPVFDRRPLLEEFDVRGSECGRRFRLANKPVAGGVTR